MEKGYLFIIEAQGSQFAELVRHVASADNVQRLHGNEFFIKENVEPCPNDKYQLLETYFEEENE